MIENANGMSSIDGNRNTGNKNPASCIDSDYDEQEIKLKAVPEEKNTCIEEFPKEMKACIEEVPEERKTFIQKIPEEKKTFIEEVPKEMKACIETVAEEMDMCIEAVPGEKKTCIEAIPKEMKGCTKVVPIDKKISIEAVPKEMKACTGAVPDESKTCIETVLEEKKVCTEETKVCIEAVLEERKTDTETTPEEKKTCIKAIPDERKTFIESVPEERKTAIGEIDDIIDEVEKAFQVAENVMKKYRKEVEKDLKTVLERENRGFQEIYNENSNKSDTEDDIRKPICICKGIGIVKCICEKMSGEENSKRNDNDCFEGTISSRSQTESYISNSELTASSGHKSKNEDVIFGKNELSTNDSGVRSSNLKNSDKDKVEHLLPKDGFIDNGISVENRIVEKIETADLNNERKSTVSEGKSSISKSIIGSNFKVGTDLDGNGGLGISSNELTKGSGMEDVKTTSKEQSKESAAKYVKAPSKEQSKESAAKGVKATSKEQSKGSATEDVKATSKEQSKGSATEDVKATSKEQSKGSATEDVKATSKEHGKGPATTDVRTSNIDFKAKQNQCNTERRKWVRQWDRVLKRYRYIHINKKQRREDAIIMLGRKVSIPQAPLIQAGKYQKDEMIKKMQGLDSDYSLHLKHHTHTEFGSKDKSSRLYDVTHVEDGSSRMTGLLPRGKVRTKASKNTTHEPDGPGERIYPGYCCNFCEKAACQTCQNCCFHYCDGCLEKLHPEIGPFKLHKVVRTTLSLAAGYCIEHGLGEKLFCETCRQDRCVECVKSKCSAHFQNRLTEEDMENEKYQLLDLMETASAALSSAGRNRVEEKASQLQLKALLRKTEIGAEFRAMRDALNVKQAQLNLELDKIVAESIEGIWTNQGGEFRRLGIEEAELTSTITGLVQSTDRVALLKGSVTAQDTCASFLRQVEDLQEEVEWSPRESTLLDCPFSLHREREHVVNALDNCFGAPEYQVVFRKNVLCDVEPHMGQMRIGAFVTGPPDPLPSTTITYTAEILQGRKLLASVQTDNIETLTLNLGVNTVYKPSQRYIFRLTTTFLHHISPWKCEYSRRRSTHMMILINHHIH